MHRSTLNLFSLNNLPVKQANHLIYTVRLSSIPKADSEVQINHQSFRKLRKEIYHVINRKIYRKRKRQSHEQQGKTDEFSSKEAGSRAHRHGTAPGFRHQGPQVGIKEGACISFRIMLISSRKTVWGSQAVHSEGSRAPLPHGSCLNFRIR